MKELIEEFKTSVHRLADSLPQWNSDNKQRRFHSAVASLFEEAGELSGLISKKRIRKNYWKAEIKLLEDCAEIKEKFTDEASDFLWVLVCSCHCLGYNDIDVFELMSDAHNEYVSTKPDLEFTLYEVFGDIHNLSISDIAGYDMRSCLYDIAYDFGMFISALNSEYGVTLESMMRSNMSKLGQRYTSDGTRKDGK